MNRQANVYMHNVYTGVVEETATGYAFTYDAAYLVSNTAQAVSKTLPLTNTTYHSNVLFPFFDGLIPEGWLLHIVEKNWKLKERDRFGLLLQCCKNCIGAVSVVVKE